MVFNGLDRPVNNLWTTTYTGDQLPDLADRIMADLGPGQAFCLWLVGPMGAGKTTLVGQLLHKAGLAPAIPVTSPTYTYMNEYEINGIWFAHLDLYRSKANLAPEDLGLADARPYHGIFVEWPDKLPGDPYLQPTHVLTIAFTEVDSQRTFSLQRC